MKFHVPAVAAAIIITVLCMGGLGLFVLLPIACIQWIWNAITGMFQVLPLINVWQATLLYLAVATMLYLSGFVRITFEAKNLE
jgi:hypothetical protein